MAAKSSDWRPGPTVCRCCLTEGCYKDISTEYFWMGKREVYSEMLLETFDLTVAYAQTGGPNSNSRLICEPCISRLRDACDFKRQVVECERVFHQHLAGGSDDIEGSSETVLRSLLEKDVKQEMGTVKVEIEAKMSDDEDFGDHGASPPDDDDDDLDDQPLTKLATKVPKKETVDLMDLMDNAKPEKRKSTTKVKTTPSKKVKKKETPKPSASKAVKPPAEKKKKGHAETKQKPKASKRGKGNSGEKDKNDIMLEKKSAVQLIMNSNIVPFKWHKRLYQCFFCDDKFDRFNDLKIHVTVQHSSVKPSDILTRIELDHYCHLVKVNVADVGCKLCDHKIESLEALKSHLLNVHELKDIGMVRDGVLPFRIFDNDLLCAICDKQFHVFQLLNRHIHVHFKNYVCDHCGVGFIYEARLKFHMKTHFPGKFPCKVCGKEFSSALGCNLHYVRIHQNVNHLKCPHCSETFKSGHTQKKHIIFAHNQASKLKCDLCPKTFLLNSALTAHIRMSHLNLKRFSCSICNWQFYRKDKLKLHMIRHGEVPVQYECEVCKKTYARKFTWQEHMRIHSNDRRFLCEYCNKAFVYKSGLKSHLRAHHSVNESRKMSNV